MNATRIYVCKGKDCCAQSGARRNLLNALRQARFEIHAVKCQKICKGPVAGLKVDGEVHWFGRLNKSKAQADFVTLALKGKASDRIKKRHSKKRDGKLRK
jgi:hypothetical protein